jgi:hypothetical protein
MDSITFTNTRGETFGIADGVAFLAKAGAELGGDLSADALQRAMAEVFRCDELHEAKLHDNAKRSVTLVVKNGVRPTDVSTMHIDTDDEAVQRDFVAAVVRNMRPTTESQTSSLWTDLLGPLIVGAFVAIVGGVVLSTASEIDAGTYQPTDRLGKARTIAKLSAAIAGVLGTTGTIVVFGLLLLLCVAWLVSVLRGKHMVTRWRVS